MSQTISETLALIKSDMLMRCEYEHKRLTKLRALRFCFYSASVSTIIYRLQIFFYCNHLKVLASLLSFINLALFTIRIDSRSKVGPGFLILHASYITIGPHVKIGKNCVMAHQNTVCPSPFYNKNAIGQMMGPTIGDGCILGGGASIFGEIALGNDVKVSMNAAVEKSFGDHAVLFGVPAKNVVKSEFQEV